MQETFDDLEKNILEEDFNLFLDLVLEAKGGSPVLKKSSISKLIEIKEKCNINLTFGELEILKKMLHISTKTSLRFSSKEIRWFFCFKYLAGIN